MILQCPACETKFLVDASLIPAAGRMVKCARCAHEWHVMGEEASGSDTPSSMLQDEEEPLAFEPMPAADSEEPKVRIEADSSSLHNALDAPAFATSDDYDIPLSPHMPVPEEKAPSLVPRLILAIILLAVCGGLALLAFRAAMPSALEPIYALMGASSTEGLALADVEFRMREARSKTNYVVEGKILNESQEIRRVPILRVALVDAEGKVLLSREYEAEAELKPGESYPFKATRLETSFGDKVDHLVVEIGNGVELMLRK